MSGTVRRWHAEHAWLPDGCRADVLLESVDGRFTRVEPEVGSQPAAGPDAERLRGVVLPGLADGHGHAFHRALRGRTHLVDASDPCRPGDFWAWRQRAYDVAAVLDPDLYLDLARATYAELALAGVTCVGEFHYLHHDPTGRPYAEADAMGAALRQAAVDAGVRLTLLDTCYLAGGLGPAGPEPVAGVQRRFADVDVDAWAARVVEVPTTATARVGAAAHSVRAVPREALGTVAAVAATTSAGVLHAHVAEQPAEVAACRAAYGVGPVGLLAAGGALGPRTTVVHATHLDAADVAALGGSGTGVCLCPSTERDLADGPGHARALADAGSPLSVGADQHVAADLLGEARGVEEHERLTSGRRGRFVPRDLLAMATAHDRLGWPEAGRLEVGARADLVVVRTDTPRTAGGAPAQVVMVATAADVDRVVVDGHDVVVDGQHVLGDVGRLLVDAVAAVDDRLGS
ncbi:formimidoylglutamate deiminase [Aquipuribacter nitratireducens]|uniref:Formimidoylglutamate deiminase n=1 Tax=Aquipuribacter nitratireducens TaxID=650104 RepID=A0ABW0GJ58_9MICO